MVAQPAPRPTIQPCRRSRASDWDDQATGRPGAHSRSALTRDAAANAASRHDAASACPMKIVARNHMGVASPNVSAANSAATGEAPQSRATSNRTTPDHAVNSPTVNTVAIQDSSASPANVSGSPPSAVYTSLTAATIGTAASACPGALSE
jgi:hypothetical protein